MGTNDGRSGGSEWIGRGNRPIGGLMRQRPDQHRRGGRVRRLGVWVGVALIGAGALASCEGKALRTEGQVVEDFAQRVLDGVDFGLSGHIEADKWDPDARMFTGVRIDGSDSQVASAERAEVIVNSYDATVVLRLHNVVFADSESGELVSRDVLVMDPIKLNERFVPDEREPLDAIGTAEAPRFR